MRLIAGGLGDLLPRAMGLQSRLTSLISKLWAQFRGVDHKQVPKCTRRHPPDITQTEHVLVFGPPPRDYHPRSHHALLTRLLGSAPGKPGNLVNNRWDEYRRTSRAKPLHIGPSVEFSMGDLPTDRELERARRSRHIAAKRRIQRRYAEKYVSHFPSDEASWRALWAHIRDEMMDDQELFNYTEDVGVELNQMSGHYDVIELEGTDE